MRQLSELQTSLLPPELPEPAGLEVAVAFHPGDRSLEVGGDFYDLFQVEDDAGERFWLYRAGDGEDAATGSHRWFLHGIFG